MLNRKSCNFIILNLIFVLILSSCTSAHLPWRTGYLIAQLYRQPQQKILLAYNDFANEMTVDVQNGYSRAYFDNYRKQMIFQRERALEYMIDGRQFTTATNEITGYISEVLINDKYQIGVEILDPKADGFGEGDFWGTKSRVIDLNTQKSVIVDGLLFNDNLIVDDYFYGFTFSKSDRALEEDAVPGSESTDDYLDIIDLRTMQHQKIDTTEHKITFLYQRERQVYGQSKHLKTSFLFENMQMLEQKESYDEKLSVSKKNWPVLKDIAPSNSNQHWYINPMKEYDIIKQASLVQLTQHDIHAVLIDFQRDDIIQIIDTANYGAYHIAILYETRVKGTEEIKEFISLYDLKGNLVEIKDMTEVYQSHLGRFISLDYVE